MIKRNHKLKFYVLGIMLACFIGGSYVLNNASNNAPPVKVNVGEGEGLTMGTEELDPDTTPVNVSLNDAIKAVEEIWSVPINAGELRSWLIRDNFEAKIFWHIEWEGELVAQVYADKGEVFYLSDRRNLAEMDNLQNTTKAVEIALSILEKIGINQTVLMEPTVHILKTPSEGEDQTIRYSITWWQVYEGIPVRDGYVSVKVNPETMKPSGFYNHIIVVEGTSTTPQVTEEEAILTAKKFVSSYLQDYKVKGIIDSQLIIGRPNYYWSSKPMKLGAPTLIWLVTLNCTYPRGFTNPVEVCVNAYDASIEGGTTYR